MIGTGMCAFHVDCPLRVAPDDPADLYANGAPLDAFAPESQPQFAANVCHFIARIGDSRSDQGVGAELIASGCFTEA
ncbi:hypothetical protein [Novosphingobium resinovorum]|uniref:hypothetical protein n=1 Tax=Novosphingobium resinovorum TaxID=158500 RepID=UPI002ED2382A|nr:hypothetical protein [Novosphingobium resinovorum]